MMLDQILEESIPANVRVAVIWETETPCNDSQKT